LYLIILIPGVQNKAGQMITQRLSEDFGMEVTLSGIRIYPIKRLIVKDFCVKDLNKDTLAYCKELSVSIDSLQLKNKHIFLGQILIKEFKSHLTYNNGISNFQFIIDSIKSRQKTTSAWKYSLDKVSIKNGFISSTNKLSENQTKTFNPNNIKLSALNIAVDKIKTFEDSVNFRIKGISCIDHSGFTLKNLNSYVAIGSTGIKLTNLNVHTNYSVLNVDYFNMSYDSISDFSEFNNKIKLDLKINSFLTDYNDFTFFTTNIPELKHRIYLNGNLKGTVNNIKGRNIKINAGSNTEILTNFDINDISDFTNCFLYLDIKELKTNIIDISKLFSLNKDTHEFNLPDSFKEMGNISYSGNLSGFVNNLVAYGNFKTDIGSIKTDIGFKFTDENKLVYSGFLYTQSLNIGKLLKTDQNLNKVTMDVSVQGYRTGNKLFNSYISGTIDSINYNNYKYKKIVLNGLFSNKRFDGRVTLNDPNAQIAFNGKMDFTDEIPAFDFTASLNNIRPYELNLTKNIPNSKFSLKISSNLSGTNLNSINGDIKIYDGELITPTKHILLDTLVINALNNDSINQIELNSDLAEAKISGKFYLNTLIKEFKKEFSNYAPAIYINSQYEKLPESDFSFNLTTKNLAGFIETINKDFFVADSSRLKGEFHGSKNKFLLSGEFEKLKINSIDADMLDFFILTDNNKFQSEFKSDFITLGNIIPFKNFVLSQQISHDTMDVNFIWNNESSISNSGSINTKTAFKRAFDNKLYSAVHILPSYIMVKDSVWNIQESSLHFSSEGIKIDAFRIHHINQEINCNGSLYNQGSNKVETYFQNINLQDITDLLNLQRLTFDGILNGNINLSGNYENPIITNNILINDLKVNQDLVGDLNVFSFWNKEEKTVEIEAIAKKENYTPLFGKGYLKPKDDIFEFEFDLDSLPIGFLNLYLSKVVQNLKGTASGKLALNSKNEEINLDGRLKVNKASMDVDLLQCHYSIEDSVTLTKNSIVFNNMKLTDSKGRKGTFSGDIKHTNFHDMSYNLYARANNMLVLNTKEHHNPLYYGTVYATGDLSISGITDFLQIDINAKSEKDTKLFIPMSDRQESLDNNFIQFVNPNTLNNTNTNSLDDIEEYQVNLSNFAMNMGIEITPDAQIQVIFDPALGDILKSSGTGNLQIQLNKEGEVSFFGDYTAENGDYLFSLENVVNKRFDINKGGSVVWKGDPYDALIDLTATYKLKTSIQPLILPSSQNSNSTDTYRRIPINCDMILTGNLSQPNIKFNISAPTMEQSTQTLIADAISTDEELNRQVLSLLIMNKFFTPDYYASNRGDKQVNSAAIANTSEMLSSQLSNWLSQISNDFDVGISYRPEDEISSEQIEVALSTQIFNDRVSINGNVEYGKYNTTQQNTNNIVGDFDMDVKLNKSGSLRIKAYTHSNDDYSYDSSPTTQGFGISYQEEFDTVGELLKKYWNWITGKGKKEKEIKLEEDQNNK